MSRKWCYFLLVVLLIGCDRNDVTPTAVSNLPTATANATAVPPTTLPPATITATSTPTDSPTQTPRPTETPDPTQTPSPTPTIPYTPPTPPPVIEMPLDTADQYTLRPWSDVEAAALAQQMTVYADEFKDDFELYGRFGDRGRREIIEIGREFILRFPNSPYRTEVEWLMFDAATYQPGGEKEWDDLLAGLITADLNAGNVTLDTLDTYLNSHGLQLSQNSCESCELYPATIPNLLGDGREIPLFLIERQSGEIDGGFLISIWQDSNGSFIVTPILSEWAAVNHYSGGIRNFETRHITGRSQPELIVQKWGHSGNMLGSVLYIFQWNGEDFMELPGTPLRFSGGPFGDEWGFVGGDESSRLEVVHNYSGITAIYDWTGNVYEPIEIITPESAPPDPNDPYLLFVERLNQYDGTSALSDYVDAAETIYSEQYDLNGDGQLDWLLVMSDPALFFPGETEVWALLETGTEAEAVRMTGLWDVEEFSVEVHPLSPFPTPLITFFYNHELTMYQIVQGESGWEVKNYLSENFVLDFTFHLVEDTPQLDLVIDPATSYGGIDGIVFQWDAETDEFIEVSQHAPNSLGIPLHEALDTAETLILENGDFAGAIPLLTAVVNEHDPTEEFAFLVSLPKALYLLGLAHEMEGNEAEAVAAYWQLWHDHPSSPYALMAAEKLVEK